MKKLTLLILSILLSGDLLARSANILSIEGDGKFPIETVTVTYQKGCHEGNPVIKSYKKDYTIYIGVKVETTRRFCLMHLPAIIVETLDVKFYADTPVDYKPLSSLVSDFNGVSIDNFGDGN